VSSADECRQCGEEEEKLKIAKSGDIRQAETEQVSILKDPFQVIRLTIPMMRVPGSSQDGAAKKRR
jgi:predicted RNA-binding protein with PUA domain